MKKRGLLGIGAAVVLCLFASMVFAQGQGDLQNHPSCKYCGMDREKFGHSRVYIEYEDGTTVGTCSIRCAAVELARILTRHRRQCGWETMVRNPDRCEEGFLGHRVEAKWE